MLVPKNAADATSLKRSVFPNSVPFSSAFSCSRSSASGSMREARNLTCCPSTQRELVIRIGSCNDSCSLIVFSSNTELIKDFVTHVLYLPNSLLCCSVLPVSFRFRQVHFDASFRRCLEHLSPETRSKIHWQLLQRTGPHDQELSNAADTALDASFQRFASPKHRGHREPCCQVHHDKTWPLFRTQIWNHKHVCWNNFVKLSRKWWPCHRPWQPSCLSLAHVALRTQRRFFGLSSSTTEPDYSSKDVG